MSILIEVTKYKSSMPPNPYKAILAEVIETLIEYGNAHKDQPLGMMAYDILLTPQENAETEGLSLDDIGLNKEKIKSLM